MIIDDRDKFAFMETDKSRGILDVGTLLEEVRVITGSKTLDWELVSGLCLLSVGVEEGNYLGHIVGQLVARDRVLKVNDGSNVILDKEQFAKVFPSSGCLYYKLWSRRVIENFIYMNYCASMGSGVDWFLGMPEIFKSADYWESGLGQKFYRGVIYPIYGKEG